MANDEVRPALSAEEWGIEAVKLCTACGAEAAESPEGDLRLQSDGGARSVYLKGRRRHAVAALALYGQPFGFTREDVARLRDAADLIAADYRLSKAGREADLAENRKLIDLADRIAALLPPEGQ